MHLSVIIMESSGVLHTTEPNTYMFLYVSKLQDNVEFWIFFC